MQSKICYREYFNSCIIHSMDKICFEPGPFGRCAANFGHLHQELTFFNHVNEINSV